MDKQDIKRLKELLCEISNIVKSNNPHSSIEILKDINKELNVLVNK